MTHICCIVRYDAWNNTWTTSSIELSETSMWGSAMFLDDDICTLPPTSLSVSPGPGEFLSVLTNFTLPPGILIEARFYPNMLF